MSAKTAARAAPVYLVKGDDVSLVAQEVRTLLAELVGERDHALVFPNDDGGSAIHRYTFEWNEPFVSALALGPGSLMNHSVTPNVFVRADFARRRLAFWTLRPVKRGEELLINYNGEPDDATPITFET